MTYESLRTLSSDNLVDFKELLGIGTFGSVYKGQWKSPTNYDPNSKSKVAIKVIQFSSNDVERLGRELYFLKRLHSPFIVEYYESYVYKNELNIVMELCDGGSLSDISKFTDHIFTEEEIKAIVACCILGLEHMHEQNSIHRDIKGGNLLLSSSGKVLISDFGVSTKLNGSNALKRTVIGSPYWMAPEILLEHPYGPKVDIWSLGITIIELCERKPPYDGVKPASAMFLITYRDPPRLTESEKWSKNMHSFLNRCLVKESDQRAESKELASHPWIASEIAILKACCQEKKVACSLSVLVQLYEQNIDILEMRRKALNYNHEKQVFTPGTRSRTTSNVSTPYDIASNSALGSNTGTPRLSARKEQNIPIIFSTDCLSACSDEMNIWTGTPRTSIQNYTTIRSARTSNSSISPRVTPDQIRSRYSIENLKLIGVNLPKRSSKLLLADSISRATSTLSLAHSSASTSPLDKVKERKQYQSLTLTQEGKNILADGDDDDYHPADLDSVVSSRSTGGGRISGYNSYTTTPIKDYSNIYARLDSPTFSLGSNYGGGSVGGGGGGSQANTPPRMSLTHQPFHYDLSSPVSDADHIDTTALTPRKVIPHRINVPAIVGFDGMLSTCTPTPNIAPTRFIAMTSSRDSDTYSDTSSFRDFYSTSLLGDGSLKVTPRTTPINTVRKVSSIENFIHIPRRLSRVVDKIMNKDSAETLSTPRTSVESFINDTKSQCDVSTYSIASKPTSDIMNNPTTTTTSTTTTVVTTSNSLYKKPPYIQNKSAIIAFSHSEETVYDSKQEYNKVNTVNNRSKDFTHNFNISHKLQSIPSSSSINFPDILSTVESTPHKTTTTTTVTLDNNNNDENDDSKSDDLTEVMSPDTDPSTVTVTNITLDMELLEDTIDMTWKDVTITDNITIYHAPPISHIVSYKRKTHKVHSGNVIVKDNDNEDEDDDYYVLSDDDTPPTSVINYKSISVDKTEADTDATINTLNHLTKLTTESSQDNSDLISPQIYSNRSSTSTSSSSFSVSSKDIDGIYVLNSPLLHHMEVDEIAVRSSLISVNTITTTTTTNINDNSKNNNDDSANASSVTECITISPFTISNHNKDITYTTDSVITTTTSNNSSNSSYGSKENLDKSIKTISTGTDTRDSYRGDQDDNEDEDDDSEEGFSDQLEDYMYTPSKTHKSVSSSSSTGIAYYLNCFNPYSNRD